MLAFQARPPPRAAAAALAERLPGIVGPAQAAQARRPQVRGTQRRAHTGDHGLKTTFKGEGQPRKLGVDPENLGNGVILENWELDF